MKTRPDDDDILPALSESLRAMRCNDEHGHDLVDELMRRVQAEMAAKALIIREVLIL